MKKIFAVVVCYNPEIDSLHRLVSQLSHELQYIVLCNNSSYQISLHEFNTPSSISVKIFNFNDNLGIAKAQSIGMEWAFSNGADFVIQMDQDSVPDEGMVFKLLDVYEELIKKGMAVGLVGAMDYDNITNKINSSRLKHAEELLDFNDVFLVSHTLSSGSLIPKLSYEKIGGMLDELFIDVVDHEYCWRLSKNGLCVVINADARFSHRRGGGDKKIFGLIEVGVPAPIRHYYAFRNIIYMLKFDYAPLRWKVEHLVKLFFKITVYPIFLNDGFSRFGYMVLGVMDGLKGKMGKIYEDN